MKKILPSGRSGKIFLTFLTKFLNKPKTVEFEKNWLYNTEII